MSKRISLAVLFFIFFLFAIFSISYAEKQKDLPNIIIITIDSLRADHVGCYGYYRDTSPYLDEFSQDAVLFKNAFSQAPHTPGSMSSFITGVYPSSHIVGTKSFLGPAASRLNPCSITLAEVLKERGYKTYFISDHPQMFFINGVSKGFDYFIQIENIEIGNDSSYKVIDNISDFFSSVKKDKFFIWVHFRGVHLPYFPNDKESLTVPLQKEKKIVPIAEKFYQVFGVIPTYVQEDGIENLNYYINSYDGKIRRIDKVVNKLFNNIKKQNLYSDSLIIVASDHGEEFGEHNLYCNHSYNVYNTLLSVPLLIKFPGQVYKGRKIKECVGLIDVMPTVLNFLDIDYEGALLQGRSFMSFIDDKGKKEGNCVYSDLGTIYSSVIFKSWKLINNKFGFVPSGCVSIDDYELYNLKNDPDEQINLVGKEKYENIFEKLRDKLRDKYEGDQNTVREKLLKCWKIPCITESNKQQDDLEVLKSLGYMH